MVKVIIALTFDKLPLINRSSASHDQSPPQILELQDESFSTYWSSNVWSTNWPMDRRFAKAYTPPLFRTGMIKKINMTLDTLSCQLIIVCSSYFRSGGTFYLDCFLHRAHYLQHKLYISINHTTWCDWKKL